MATVLNTTTSKGAGNYVGETRKQLRDGFGVYNYPNKFFRYEGEWSKGKKHGHGKLLMADGSFYEGQFQDGEIQGHGFRRWASSKNEYTGQFVRGEMMGHGIMKCGNGSRYEGEWMNNQKEGKGKLYGKDGSVYEGSFHSNKKHGQGNHTYSNGEVYEGDWVNDLRQGHGVMKYEDGTIYAGQWWGGEAHGEGSIIHASGLSFEGLWTGGRPAAEAVAIRVVGKPQQDVMQGRPFGFEVECVSLDGERVPEDGRLLQVTGWTRIYGKKSSAKSSDADERLPTPFGFDVEPYYLTESLGDMSADNMLYGGLNAPSSVMSTRPLQTTSPSESTLDVQIPLDNGSDNGDKEGSATESHHDLLNRQTVGSQASTTINTSIDKGIGDIEQPLPSPPSTVRTTQGRAIFENLYLPALPTGTKSFTSLHEVEIRPEQSTRRASLMKWKKGGSVINPNLLSNTPMISEGGSKKKKEALADIVEKSDPKFKKSKEIKRDEKSADDKLCKPGDYVIVVQDVTIPKFLDSRLQPAFIHIRLTPKKRDKSKIDVRRNWIERQENLRQEKERSDGNPA